MCLIILLKCFVLARLCLVEVVLVNKDHRHVIATHPGVHYYPTFREGNKLPPGGAREAKRVLILEVIGAPVIRAS